MSLRVSGNADRFADRIGPYGFAVLLGKSWRVNPFCGQRGDKCPRPVTLPRLDGLLLVIVKIRVEFTY
jgi:hypothetical protein